MEIEGYLQQKKDFFKKLEQELLEKKSGTLFGLDWSMVEKGHCPICTCKIYEMRNRPFLFCKSNKHKRFMISKEKVEKIKSLSGAFTESALPNEIFPNRY